MGMCAPASKEGLGEAPTVSTPFNEDGQRGKLLLWCILRSFLLSFSHEQSHVVFLLQEFYNTRLDLTSLRRFSQTEETDLLFYGNTLRHPKG